MYELDANYLTALEDLAQEIQDSGELAAYLDSEEEDDFNQLKELFEPRIMELHQRVAEDNPLQLISFELVVLESVFEGLCLPKILGYSVLRGEIDKNFQYVRPQDHFREVLLAICQSPNFEILKKRIGQSIQMGFALSSDIWITNLINGIDNKRVRYFLQAQKLDKYYRQSERALGYERYSRQFVNDNFLTAEFPESASDLPQEFSPLKNFLIYRITHRYNNTSLLAPLHAFVMDKQFHGTKEHMEIMGLYALFFPMSDADRKATTKVLNKVRQEMPEFADNFLEFLLSLHHNPKLDVTPEADKVLSGMLDFGIADSLTEYYKLVDLIHGKGYNNEEVQDAVRVFHSHHEGLSTINECVRQTILHYFVRFISNLEERAYPDYFEISKLFPVYMKVFNNEHFNQGLKELSMKYVKKLLKLYTDKRGKDYQDIKKFVSAVFVDLEFLREKEVVEMFKTRRKKKEA